MPRLRDPHVYIWAQLFCGMIGKEFWPPLSGTLLKLRTERGAHTWSR